MKYTQGQRKEVRTEVREQHRLDPAIHVLTGERKREREWEKGQYSTTLEETKIYSVKKKPHTRHPANNSDSYDYVPKTNGSPWEKWSAKSWTSLLLSERRKSIVSSSNLIDISETHNTRKPLDYISVTIR